MEQGFSFCVTAWPNSLHAAALSCTSTGALLPFSTAKQHLRGVGWDPEHINPPRENLSLPLHLPLVLFALVKSSLMLFGSLSQLARRPEPKPEPGGPGKPALVTAWWLQPSQLTAGILPALQGDQDTPKNEGQQGPNSESPALSQSRAQSLPWSQGWGCELRAGLAAPFSFQTPPQSWNRSCVTCTAAFQLGTRPAGHSTSPPMDLALKGLISASSSTIETWLWPLPVSRLQDGSH